MKCNASTSQHFIFIRIRSGKEKCVPEVLGVLSLHALSTKLICIIGKHVS